MKEISIEYAHIYTNDKIGKNQKLSLKILSTISKQNTSLVVMVDDYSFPDPTFDYDKLIKWLTKEGFRPDVIIRESQLIPLCDEVVRLIQDKRLKEEILSYIYSKKYPCSLFISAWYLLRLGHLHNVIFNSRFFAKKAY